MNCVASKESLLPLGMKISHAVSRNDSDYDLRNGSFDVNDRSSDVDVYLNGNLAVTEEKQSFNSKYFGKRPQEENSSAVGSEKWLQGDGQKNELALKTNNYVNLLSYMREKSSLTQQYLFGAKNTRITRKITAYRSLKKSLIEQPEKESEYENFLRLYGNTNTQRENNSNIVYEDHCRQEKSNKSFSFNPETQTKWSAIFEPKTSKNFSISPRFENNIGADDFNLLDETGQNSPSYSPLSIYENLNESKGSPIPSDFNYLQSHERELSPVIDCRNNFDDISPSVTYNKSEFRTVLTNEDLWRRETKIMANLDTIGTVEDLQHTRNTKNMITLEFQCADENEDADKSNSSVLLTPPLSNSADDNSTKSIDRKIENNAYVVAMTDKKLCTKLRKAAKKTIIPLVCYPDENGTIVFSEMTQ